MAQPSTYTRGFNYKPLAPANVPEAGDRLNIEFDEIASIFAEYQTNLAFIQRDDRRLANQAVHPESLSARTRSLIVGGWPLRGDWLTGTAYQAKDVVAESGVLYVALEDHTAGVFATDLAAGKWLTWYEESMIPADNTILPSMLAPSFGLPLDKLDGFTAEGTGAAERSVPDRLGEIIYATDYGADRTGVADSTAALNNAAAYAASVGGVLVVPRGTFKTTGTVTIPAGCAGLLMEGTISYAGPGLEVALLIGASGATKTQAKTYRGLSVVRASQADWTNEADIGIRLRNVDACEVEVRRVEGFTIGVQVFGDQTGAEDSTFRLGRIVNNKIGVDIYTNTANGWCNSNVFIGGHIANDSGLHTVMDRYGVRLARNTGAYNLHNANRFFGQNFELQWQGGAVRAIPFLVEVDARALHAYGMRTEACSRQIARHTAGARDCIYEAAWVGTHAYTVEVEYADTATRAGGVVRALSSGSGQQEFGRMIAGVPNVRAAAFRENTNDIGFEGLCTIGGTSGGLVATTLRAASAAGYTLSSVDVTILTGNRGLAFPVRTAGCRDFALGLDADDNARVVVRLFDGSSNLLTNSTNFVLASEQTMNWNAGAGWWETSTALNDANLNRLIHLHLGGSGIVVAQIGVARIGANAVVRAMRLYSDPRFAPVVWLGTSNLAYAGSRRLPFSHAYDPPDIAAGATAQENVTVTGAAPGDSVEVGFTLASTGIMWFGTIGASDTATVVAWNRSGGNINLAPGTLYGAVVKPLVA